jgi:D-glycero-alpha-D-manno-heptose-7-phosphate kinase
MEALDAMKEDAYCMKEFLLKGDFASLAGCMRRSWVAKKRLADNVSNSTIDHVVESALEAGAQAGKISGAGGGGFITFLVDPKWRVNVIRALSRHEGRVMTCHFTRHGTEGWKIL